MDDDPTFVDVSSALLEREDEELRRLSEATFDRLVSDDDMPDRNGTDFLEAVRAEVPPAESVDLRNIVERVADAHGWTVRVTESERGGARFEITGVEFTD